MDMDRKPRYVAGKAIRSGDTATAMEKWKGKEKVGHEEQSMFNEWVSTFGKAYGSDKERDEFFQIFLSAKEFIEQHISLNRFEALGLKRSADNGIALSLNKPADTVTAMSLNKPANKKDSKRQRRSFKGPLGLPSLVGKHLPDYTKEMNNEELKEATAEFGRWAAAHGKVYVSEEERHKRFVIFLYKKKRLVPPGLGDADFWTYKNEHHWEILDLMWWESVNAEDAACTTCKCDDFCDCGDECECEDECNCKD